MAVAYGGHPGELAALRALAGRRAACMLLEDAAHAIGARLDGPPRRHVRRGRRVLSFFSNKNLAVGEGGMVVTDDDELAERDAAAALARHDDADLGPPPRPRLRLRRRRARLQLPASTSRAPRWRTARLRAARRRERPPRARSTRRYRERLGGAACAPRAAAGAAPAHHLFTIVLDGRRRPRRVPRRARRARRADERALPARAPLLDLRRTARPELPLTDAYAAARGHAAAVRAR